MKEERREVFFSRDLKKKKKSISKERKTEVKKRNYAFKK